MPGDIFLIPGEIKQESHEDIKKMCLDNSRFDFVIILNGKTKSIECEIEIYNKDLKQKVKTKEVSEWLSEWYKEHNIKDKKIAFTGNLCLSRGITISSNTCQITHIIFGSSSANIREEEQLLSRVCGYCYDANRKPKVICEKDVWDRVTKYQKVVIKLTEKAMSDNRKLTTDELESIIHETIMQDNDKEKPLIETFDKFTEMKLWFDEYDETKPWFDENRNNTKYGPEKEKEDKDSRGFYKCITKTDKQLKVRDTKEFKKNKEQNNWGINKGDNKNLFIWYPCYRDINDIETLEYWLVYYKK